MRGEEEKHSPTRCNNSRREAGYDYWFWRNDVVLCWAHAPFISQMSCRIPKQKCVENTHWVRGKTQKEKDERKNYHVGAMLERDGNTNIKQVLLLFWSPCSTILKQMLCRLFPFHVQSPRAVMFMFCFILSRLHSSESDGFSSFAWKWISSSCNTNTFTS